MKSYCSLPALCVCLLLPTVEPLLAHVGQHPSVHDTVAGIIARMKREFGAEELRNLTVPKVEQFLTPRERELLGSEHVSFRVNVPVRVSILHDARLGDEPFWLRERGFQKTGVAFKEGKVTYEVLAKDFQIFGMRNRDLEISFF